MAENSGISWTDHTFNPWMGCTKVSPACKHCYAERDMDHRYAKVAWGPNGTRVLTSETNWKKPLKWNRQAAGGGSRARVFCASLADVFEDWNGPIVNNGTPVTVADDGSLIRNPDCPFGHREATMDDVRRQLFALIDATPNLDWLLLTKRPENILRMWNEPTNNALSPFPMKRSNVWLGTSVENQEYADKRIPELLKCRDISPVLFLSCEPLVGPVELSVPWDGEQALPTLQVDWVIAGGESGPDARPAHPDWFRSIRDQCDEADVPFHFKQWGEFGPESLASPVQINNAMFEVCEHGERVYRVGVKQAGRSLDGVTHDAFPEVRYA